MFKKINSKDKEEEINRVKLMSKEYPDLFPQIYFLEKDAYLMDYIEGKTFFDLNKNEKIRKVESASENLHESWNGKYGRPKDIRQKILSSFNKYRKKGERFFSENELTEIDLKHFSEVQEIVSHNDLNAANLIYTEKGIKLIDPSEEGFEDIARDVGRYCASTFFNQYDYFGNEKKFCLEIAEAFLEGFDSQILARAKYYIGESFMSFMNFDTISTGKNILKRLCVNTLTKDKPIINCLEESL